MTVYKVKSNPYQKITGKYIKKNNIYSKVTGKYSKKNSIFKKLKWLENSIFIDSDDGSLIIFDKNRLFLDTSGSIYNVSNKNNNSLAFALII